MTEPRDVGKLRGGESDGVSPQTTTTTDDRPGNEAARRSRPRLSAVLWGLALWLALFELIWFSLHELIRLAN
jgi:hypothetical protein